MLCLRAECQTFVQSYYSPQVATLYLRFSGDGELGTCMLACFVGVELEGALLALPRELEWDGLGGMGGVGGSLNF